LTEKNIKKRVAWGITGSGDKILEIFEIMNDIKQIFENKVDIRVFLSKAGEQVIKYYGLVDDLKQRFTNISVEVNANSPFLAGALQLGKFEFLLIAPATSNTVAKIASGIADTLLCNAAIMALKAFIPVYVLPSDLREGVLVTTLPNGNTLKLRIRKEDVENVKKLEEINDLFIIKEPSGISKVFKKHFKN